MIYCGTSVFSPREFWSAKCGLFFLVDLGPAVTVTVWWNCKRDLASQVFSTRHEALQWMCDYDNAVKFSLN